MNVQGCLVSSQSPEHCPIAWENRKDKGLIKSFWKTVWMLFVTPKKFFRCMEPSPAIYSTLVFCGLASFFSFGIAGILQNLLDPNLLFQQRVPVSPAVAVFCCLLLILALADCFRITRSIASAALALSFPCGFGTDPLAILTTITFITLIISSLIMLWRLLLRHLYATEAQPELLLHLAGYPLGIVLLASSLFPGPTLLAAYILIITTLGLRSRFQISWPHLAAVQACALMGTAFTGYSLTYIAAKISCYLPL